MAGMLRLSSLNSRIFRHARNGSSSRAVRSSILCVGGLVKDIICRPGEESGTLLMGSSMPGHVSNSFGGVARNIAEAIGRLEVSSQSPTNSRPRLAAIVGGNKVDNSGDWPAIRQHCEEVYIDNSMLLQLPPSIIHVPTPTYAAMLDEKGGLVAAIADFRAIDAFSLLDDVGNDNLTMMNEAIKTSKTIVFDANFSVETYNNIGDALNVLDKQAEDVIERTIWWEPTSVAKCTRYLRSSLNKSVTHVSPNLAELLAMDHACHTSKHDITSYYASENACASLSAIVTPYLQRELDQALKAKDLHRIVDLVEVPLTRVAHGTGQGMCEVVLTLGEYGAIVVQHANSELIAHWIPGACLNTELSGPIGVGKDSCRTNVTGAGDTMVGTTLWWLNRNEKLPSPPMKLLRAVYAGSITGAAAVLEVDAAVPKLLSQPAVSEYLTHRIDNESDSTVIQLPFQGYKGKQQFSDIQDKYFKKVFGYLQEEALTDIGMGSSKTNHKSLKSPKNELEATIHLAHLFRNGFGVEQNHFEATNLFLKAKEIDDKNEHVNYYLAHAYFNGQGVSECGDPVKEAFALLEPFAKKGNVKFQVALGAMCLKLQDSETGSNNSMASQGFEWYLKAANQGDAVAQNMVGVCFATGRGVGTSPDYVQAAKWYLLSAQQNNMVATNNLGALYRQGHPGVDQDKMKAFALFLRAAQGGNVDAQFNLGLMYDAGEGPIETKDYSKAFSVYMMAATQGHHAAQSNVAIMYARGEGVEQSREEAQRWYVKAAERGNATAQHNLANIYEEDYHNENSPEKRKMLALELLNLYTKAANQKRSMAQFKLGQYYEFGFGGVVEINTDKAVEWYEEAASQGHRGAAERIAALSLKK